LSDRKQFVQIKNIKSCTKPVPAGVPLGSVFGSTLFTIYTASRSWPFTSISRHELSFLRRWHANLPFVWAQVCSR
jgi:hypothetical protein